MAKAFWRREPEPTKLQRLTTRHDELFDEVQHAQIQFSKWKHSLAHHLEEFKRVTKEMEQMLKEQSAQQGESTKGE